MCSRSRGTTRRPPAALVLEPMEWTGANYSSITLSGTWRLYRSYTPLCSGTSACHSATVYVPAVVLGSMATVTLVCD